jgi:hypothetical protein
MHLPSKCEVLSSNPSAAKKISNINKSFLRARQHELLHVDHRVDPTSILSGSYLSFPVYGGRNEPKSLKDSPKSELVHRHNLESRTGCSSLLHWPPPGNCLNIWYWLGRWCVYTTLCVCVRMCATRVWAQRCPSECTVRYTWAVLHSYLGFTCSLLDFTDMQ